MFIMTCTAALLAKRRPMPLSSPSYSIRIPFTFIRVVLRRKGWNRDWVRGRLLSRELAEILALQPTDFPGVVSDWRKQGLRMRAVDFKLDLNLRSRPMWNVFPISAPNFGGKIKSSNTPGGALILALFSICMEAAMRIVNNKIVFLDYLLIIWTL